MIPLKTILHATDFSSSAHAALPIACSLARDYGARLLLLYVRPTPPAMIGEFGGIAADLPESDESVQARLRQLLPDNFRGEVKCLVGDGDAAEEIVSAAQDSRCDMIVLGTHGRSGLGRLLLGSVAEAVLRLTPCPVLTIKPAALAMSAEQRDEEPTFDARDLKVVASVENRVKAEVIRGALQNEGIVCLIDGGNQAGFAGTLGIPVNIQVRVGDWDRANRFIQRQEAVPT